MKFPRTRSGEHAVQAVSVLARQPPGAGEDLQLGSAPAGLSESAARPLSEGRGQLRTYTYTFCLERVTSGPYKDCWMTVGVRCGDYANV